MNATLRKATSILLSILMTLSLLTVGITTAVAETAPTLDGVKDDIYTDSKRVIIPYAYGGAGQPGIENTYGVYSTSYFTWDDTSVYLYIETYDPQGVAQMDLVYLVSDISTDMTGYVHENASGAYMQYTPSSSDLQTGGNLALDCKVKVTETGRSYEIKFDRVGTTGFSFTPVIYVSPSYTASYQPFYFHPGSLYMVYYDDQSTWTYGTAPTPEPEPEPSGTVDGVKDDKYTDDKKTVINTAFAGVGGAAIENTHGVYSTSWYTWDDTNVYYYCDIYDPNTVSQMDVFYFVNDHSTDTANFVNDCLIYTPSDQSVQTSGTMISDYRMQVTETGRSYEFQFSRAQNAGFSIGPVIYVSAEYTVSYQPTYYHPGYLKQVAYEDSSTWVYPTPQPDPEPTGRADGVKDEIYNDEDKVILDTAFGGVGADAIENTHGVYSTSWYAWDDTSVYYYCEIYDPNKIAQSDVFYFINGLSTDELGFVHEQSNGAYLQYTLADGSIATGGSLAMDYTYEVTDTGRVYEFVFDRAQTEGFSFGPVIYVSAEYTVSYKSKYFHPGNLYKVSYYDFSDYKELTMQTWNAGELAEAGAAVGTKNSHDYPVFTTFYDVIGRRSTANVSDLFIHNFNIAGNTTVNGEPVIFNGQEYTMFIKLMAGDGFDVGNLCTVDMIYGFNEYGSETFRTTYDISLSEYEETATQVDPTYGYEYKEIAITFPLNNEIFDEEDKKVMQFRVWASNADVPVNVYSMEIIDPNENVIRKAEGNDLTAIPGAEGTYEPIYADEENPSGLASYSGTDEGCLPGRGEPYSLYNGDGLNRSESEKYRMIDGLGATLGQGTYSFSFDQASMYSLGGMRVYYSVTDKTDGKVIAELNVTYTMVDETVGRDTGTFETRSVPFTVTEAMAGHEFTFQVDIYNQTDYFLRSASLNMMVDADATAPETSQKVIDAINALDITDEEATAAVRAEYEKLDTLGKAWVGAELEQKLSMYEDAQTEAAEINAAIAALGNKDELTADNYTGKTDALKAAEKARRDFAKLYGAEISAKLVDEQALTDYRTAYDAAEAEAEEKIKQAEIQKVVDAINAIGSVDEITKDNAAAKQELVNAAETAVDALISTYGQDVTAEVSNYNTLADAKAKISEVTAYTLGDVNEDGEINASDALLALQHSVKLTTLEGNDFAAADVDASEVVDATDALYILQHSVRLIDKFPAEK